MSAAQRKRLEALEQKAGEYIPLAEVKVLAQQVMWAAITHLDAATATRFGDRLLELMYGLSFYDPLEPGQRQL